MAGVEFKGVEKAYPSGVTALRGVDLKVADGEFLVLVGPSGCGKSTLLRLVAGLEDPTRGDIYIGGARVNGLAPARRGVAMVFQNYSLYEYMNVYKNISIGLPRRGAEGDETWRRVAESASALGIGDLLERSPRELSGGQNQRVALARAMVREPEVFLLDEPLSDLDAAMRAELRCEISALHKRLGAAFIYVTHDQTEALTMGDRLAVMRDGAIEQAAAPGTIYREPGNVFVARFIGQGMNLVRTEISGGEAGFCGAPLAVPGCGRRGISGPVTLGLRPEDIAVKRGGGIKGEVIGSEIVGAAAYLRVRCGGEELVAVGQKGEFYRPGSAVTLEPDASAAHIFDVDTGERI
jgi:ABC-type sugar transport system ATPase subunit